MATEFTGSLPIGGRLVGQRKKVAALANAYVGMPMAYNTTNDNYEYNATAPEAILIEAGTSIAANKKLVLAVSGSEIISSGIKDNTGADLTLTDDAIQNLLKNGVIVRKDK